MSDWYVYILSCRWHDAMTFQVFSTCLSKNYVKNSVPWKRRDDKIYERLPSPRTYFRVCVYVCVCVCLFTHTQAYICLYVCIYGYGCVCLIEHHGKKAYGGVEVSFIILNCEIRSEWPASHPNSFISGDWDLHTDWMVPWVSPKSKKFFATVSNRTAIPRSQSQCRLNYSCSLSDAW
jgi:hypothetical protein